MSTARQFKEEDLRTPSTWWLTLPATLVLAVVVAMAAAPLFHVDRFREGMLLTYPPRYLCLALAVAATAVLAGCGCRRRAWIAMSCCGLLGVQFGWGPASLGAAVDETDGFSVLAFNVQNETAHVADLAELCREKKVDFLLLQEVSPENRSAFVSGLTEFEFFHADESKAPERSDARDFTLLIGIQRSLTNSGKLSRVQIQPAITGHRTFALRLPIQQSRAATTESDIDGLWLVNVHTTESFQMAETVNALCEKNRYQSARHVSERDQIESWLARHQDEPVILGGDFNAPWNSHNLRINGLDNAHLAVGAGPHLTYPRIYPIWGVDHILGTAPIEFLSYRLLDTGFSDHCAQIGRFRIRGFQRDHLGE